jgi:hypothetical protein
MPKKTATTESKRARFERVVNKRVSGALKQIGTIANMGGPTRYSYEFSADDVAKIVAALGESVMKLQQTMVPPGHQLDVEWDINKV